MPELDSVTYASPRWSSEITDCSMPMTFDTYNRCSYGCAYCFSANQKGIGKKGLGYWTGAKVRAVDPEWIQGLFLGTNHTKKAQQFRPYIEARRPMQWGGLADQFDENEREFGVTLELLRFFRAIEYPLSFSTKAAWWTADPRYTECFKGFPWFNVKFSIITLDEDKAAIAERGVPSPRERLKAMERAAAFVGGGVTLRLRPFVLGISNPSFRDLIRAAADCGATAVSTEFLCLEQRSPARANGLYDILSDAAGFDLWDLYKGASRTNGYLRLNRAIKQPIFEEMKAICADVGLRFYCSDADGKDLCDGGSCCGLTPAWNYNRGQFTEAAVLAKANGTVRWSEISADLASFATWTRGASEGYNTRSSEFRAKFDKFTMYDFIRYLWNHPKEGNSPYHMFDGVLVPDGVDDNGDVIYRYDGGRTHGRG